MLQEAALLSEHNGTTGGARSTAQRERETRGAQERGGPYEKEIRKNIKKEGHNGSRLRSVGVKRGTTCHNDETAEILLFQLPAMGVSFLSFFVSFFLYGCFPASRRGVFRVRRRGSGRLPPRRTDLSIFGCLHLLLRLPRRRAASSLRMRLFFLARAAGASKLQQRA